MATPLFCPSLPFKGIQPIQWLHLPAVVAVFPHQDGQPTPPHPGTLRTFAHCHSTHVGQSPQPHVACFGFGHRTILLAQPSQRRHNGCLQGRGQPVGHKITWHLVKRCVLGVHYSSMHCHITCHQGSGSCHHGIVITSLYCSLHVTLLCWSPVSFLITYVCIT